MTDLEDQREQRHGFNEHPHFINEKLSFNFPFYLYLHNTNYKINMFGKFISISTVYFTLKYI